jgi:hypothetical protein
MLKPLTILASAAIFAVCVSAQSNRDVGTNQQPARQEQPVIHPATGGQAQAKAADNQGKAGEDTSLERPYWWAQSDWWLVVIAGVTGLVIGWQAWETRKSARGAQEAAQASERSARAQMDADRAWVIVSVHGQPEHPLTKQLFLGVIPDLVLELQVFGNTPAKITSEKIRCHVVGAKDTTLPPKPTLDLTPDYSQCREFADGPVTLPPGHKFLRNICLEFVSGADVMAQVVAVAHGQAVWCCYGKIEYEDAFKRKGVTQFCAIYRPQMGGVITSPNGVVLNPPGFYMDGPSGYNYNS